MKLAILTSHVIQYQTPLFKKLTTAGVDLTVYFCWDFGAKKTYDPQFRKEVEWDIPLLDGFRHVFLKNISWRPSSGFWGQINFGVASALVRGRYGAVLVYGWNSFTNLLAILTAKFFGIKVLLHSESPLNQELMKPAWKRALKRLIFPILFSLANALLFIGEENRKFYEHYGVLSGKLFFVPYAVDNERFMKDADVLKESRHKIRASLGISEGSFAVLFTGKFISKKRPFDLLKSFELLTSRYALTPKPYLLFVGDGELRGALEEYTRSHNILNVRFEGFKNQSELARYYTAANAFALPSGIGETWGLVVNEAMCFGLPVVVSDVVGCVPNLVHEGENGYIISLGDHKTLADCLARLACNSALRTRFGAASRRIITRYSHEEDVKGVRAALTDEKST